MKARSPTPIALTVLALVAAAAAGAGCFGPDGADAAPAAEDAPAPIQNATLPDGRESSALKESNRTTGGLGGREHDHDYWNGTDSLVVYEGYARFNVFPVFPHGEGSEPRAAGIVKLPPGSLVPEGAGRVEVLLAAPQTPYPQPVPRDVLLEYRTAADAEWREPVPVNVGEALLIDVAPTEADMPHSVHSLWAFRFSDSHANPLSLPLTITAFKARNVTEWPGHPDLYAERTSRVVLDKVVTTSRNGMSEEYLYGAASTWVRPDLTIGDGTVRLHVFANITKASSATGAAPKDVYLNWHNATALDDDEDGGHSAWDDSPPEDGVGHEFVIDVDAYGMDGPYETMSRWGFRLGATFGTVPGAEDALACSACTAYEIEYRLTVIAVGEAAAGEEPPPDAPQ